MKPKSFEAATEEEKALTLDERRGAVTAAIGKILYAGLAPDARPEAWVEDVFDEYAIVRLSNTPGQYLKMLYTVDEQGVVTVTPREEWTPTTKEWKMLTLNDRSWAVTTAINAMLNAGRPPDSPSEAVVYEVFDEFAVVIAFATPGQFLKAPYTIDEMGIVTVAPREEWTSTSKAWRAFDDAMVAFGGEIKALDSVGRVGGYGVLFGDEEHKDLTGTWFAGDTNYGPHDGDGAQTTMNHCLPLGPELKAFAERLLAPVKATKDAIGIFVETVLNLADEYEKIVYELAQAGKFKWSSGTAQRLIRAEKNGKLTNWPVIEWALTPIPAEPRLNAVTPLKSFAAQLAAGTPGAGPEVGGQPTASAVETAVGGGESGMVGTGNAEGDSRIAPTSEEDEMAEIDVKAIARQAADDAVAAVMAALKGTPAQDGAGFVTAAPAGDKDKGAIKAVNVLRYGKLDEDKEVVMHEVYGGDFRDLIDRQVRAFKTYVRKGERGLDRDADAILHRQLWDVDDVTGLLKSGMSVAEIKATMVEGIDVLGGYAVAPQTNANIIARMKGLTAVRDGGALVVQTSSNMLQWLKLTGGGDQYPTGMRGAWGTEIQTPAAKNFTVGLLEIPVNVYTYKVPMSVSVVEDASNLITILEGQIADTLSIDEDTVSLTGDGANKPRGILPGGLNTDSYDHAASLSGSTLTWAGLNGLRRTVKSQYRANGRASMIGNSDTGAVIESLVDGMSRPYVEELISGVTKVKSATWRESEAMPDATAGLVPLIYADLSAYAIVERLGLSIQRYNDSYTGINVIEFHVRKRIGGHVIEPWKIAVQVVEAS